MRFARQDQLTHLDLEILVASQACGPVSGWSPRRTDALDGDNSTAALRTAARFDAPGSTALDLTNAELGSHLRMAAGVRVRGRLPGQDSAGVDAGRTSVAQSRY